MSESPSQRWQRIQELLDAALEIEPASRDAFLDDACRNDHELRAELASLIAAHEGYGPADRLESGLAPLGARVRSAAVPLAGQLIGPYRVLEQLTDGGMGVVYKALDIRLGRTVALKFLQSPVGIERFRLEARAVAALEHPNICTVFEIGESNEGQPYLVMPLYDGETLQQRIARGPLAVDDAVAIAMQITRGLAKAHEHGIVHRDIKPSNVLITSDGVVKLLDFGIAKLRDVTLTGAAGPPGTLAYMSPEQQRGESVDERTDLWSLGLVLYEMLAGHRPNFGQPDFIPASLRTTRPEVPAALERIIAKALKYRPEDRYASAREFEADLLELGDASNGSRISHARQAGERNGWLRWGKRAVVIAAGIAGLILTVALWLDVPRAAGRKSEPPTTIAVLPFVDLSPGQDQEYFSNGITDELIATLARVEELRVVSRTSSFSMKDRALDVRAVGIQLGVNTVLEGSVRRSGDRLRITAQLVNVADGYSLWSETYDRDATDAFEIQQEIARAIAQTLRRKLVGAEEGAARDAPDPHAYDLYLKGRHALYLKGRYAWYSRTEEGLRSAADYFEQAVASDSTYARAHAGLADAYAVLGFYDFMPPSEAFPRAELMAKRALSLDPAMGAAHATLGYKILYYDWDLARAEREFLRAIELEPGYSTAHQWYANLLVAAGRFDEAKREMQRAQDIDPLSLIASAAMGWVLYFSQDYPAALAQVENTLDLNADYGVAHLWKGWALQELDSLDSAVRAHRRAVEVSDSSRITMAALARSLALHGERSEAEALLRKLNGPVEGGGYAPSYEIAKVYLALGNRDRAMTLLERAYTERSHSMVFLRVDPQLAELQSEPRFTRLVARVFPE